MMNGSIALPILTFLVGGFIGAFIAARVVHKDYSRRIDKLTFENNYLNERSGRLLDQNEKLIGEMETMVGEPLESLRKDRVDFVALSRKYKDDAFDSHFAERVGPEDDPPLRDPYIISEEDFDLVAGEMSTIELRFYQVDEVLTTVEDVPLEEPYNEIGDDVLEILNTTEEDVIRVRNDTYDMVYEITIEHCLSFHVDVLGEEDLS